MMDKISAEKRSRNMSRIRSTDTKPELIVRKLTYALGYRYRLHIKDLPGKPDLCFKGRRKVIFVNGCFWHCHPGCDKWRYPKSNTSYWKSKLDRNVERDKANQQKLKAQGWDYLVIWECELADMETLSNKIQKFLSPD